MARSGAIGVVILNTSQEDIFIMADDGGIGNEVRIMSVLLGKRFT